MYTATMRYVFKKESFSRGCAEWKETVFKEAQKAEGLIRMQFLVAEPVALAMGTWREKSDAEAFMRTGVFKKLMEKIATFTETEPKSEIWNLDSFFEK